MVCDRQEKQKQKNKQTKTKTKKQILMNKPVHLGHSILELSKILMHQYDYVKQKIWWKSKILLYGYMQTVYIKTDLIYKDIAEGTETRFDT